MHSHSVSSDDSCATVEGYLKWVRVLRSRGHQIDGLVLTEHRKFDADADYSALAGQYEVMVLKGSELDTRHGHFLVYGVTDALLREVDFSDVSMDSLELMREARDRGAVVVPAHPGRPGIGLHEFVNRGIEFPQVGIVETLNGGSRSGENERAQDLAMTLDTRGIGGSDAHMVSAIARCLTRFPRRVRTESELVEALLLGEFRPVTLDEARDGRGTPGQA